MDATHHLPSASMLGVGFLGFESFLAPALCCIASGVRLAAGFDLTCFFHQRFFCFVSAELGFDGFLDARVSEVVVEDLH